MTTDANPTLAENMLLLRREDIDDLLDRAAERGAERCLAHLGLDNKRSAVAAKAHIGEADVKPRRGGRSQNGHAARDLRELRDLLEAWRDARKTAWQTTIKLLTTAILAALLVGAAIKLKLMGGGQ